MIFVFMAIVVGVLVSPVGEVLDQPRPSNPDVPLTIHPNDFKQENKQDFGYYDLCRKSDKNIKKSNKYIKRCLDDAIKMINTE